MELDDIVKYCFVDMDHRDGSYLVFVLHSNIYIVVVVVNTEFSSIHLLSVDNF